MSTPASGLHLGLKGCHVKEISSVIFSSYWLPQSFRLCYIKANTQEGLCGLYSRYQNEKIELENLILLHMVHST